MSKERKIDDAELAEVSGAGEFVKPDATPGDDDAQVSDRPTDGSGDPGPGAPEPTGGGGGGNQTPNMD
jgi:hypothetical protein